MDYCSSSEEERQPYYCEESSSSESEPDRPQKEESDNVAVGFAPIESYLKNHKTPKQPPLWRKASGGYDAEVEEDEVADCPKVAVVGPRGWPVIKKQRPEYDREEEEDSSRSEDDYVRDVVEVNEMVSKFEIVDEGKGLLEQQRFIQTNFDEEEQQKYIERTAERHSYKSTAEDDFDVISFTTNDPPSLVEINAGRMNVEVHWRNGQRPGNGCEKQALGKAIAQAVRNEDFLFTKNLYKQDEY